MDPQQTRPTVAWRLARGNRCCVCSSPSILKSGLVGRGLGWFHSKCGQRANAANGSLETGARQADAVSAADQAGRQRS